MLFYWILVRPLTRSVTLSYYISSVSTESTVRPTSGYSVSFKTAPNLCLLMALTPILFLSPLVCRKALYLVRPYSYSIFNDIADVPKSELQLFADDTVLYRAIKSQHDQETGGLTQSN